MFITLFFTHCHWNGCTSTLKQKVGGGEAEKDKEERSGGGRRGRGRGGKEERRRTERHVLSLFTLKGCHSMNEPDPGRLSGAGVGAALEKTAYLWSFWWFEGLQAVPAHSLNLRDNGIISANWQGPVPPAIRILHSSPKCWPLIFTESGRVRTRVSLKGHSMTFNSQPPEWITSTTSLLLCSYFQNQRTS